MNNNDWQTPLMKTYNTNNEPSFYYVGETEDGLPIFEDAPWFKLYRLEHPPVKSWSRPGKTYTAEEFDEICDRQHRANEAWRAAHGA